MKLWPRPRVRPIRFHDLRHTTATLLLQQGASLAVTQKVMRHSTPTLTAETSGHLEQAHLRAAVDQLRFGVEALAAPSVQEPVEQARSVVNGESQAPTEPPPADKSAQCFEAPEEKPSMLKGLNGRGGGIRTRGPQLPKLVLYQTELRPDGLCSVVRGSAMCKPNS